MRKLGMADGDIGTCGVRFRPEADMLADKESGGSVDIQRLTGFETYRDGGSISASFAGTDGCEYTLMLKVKLGSTATGIVKLGYTPILSKCNKIGRFEALQPPGSFSPEDWAETETEVDWKVAGQVLANIGVHLDGRGAGDRDMYASMQSITKVGTETGRS